MTENAENRYQNRYHSYTRGNKRRQLRRRRRRRQETERGGPQEAAGVWVAALSRKRWITGLTSKLLRSFLPLPYSSPLLVLRRLCDVIHVQCVDTVGFPRIKSKEGSKLHDESVTQGGSVFFPQSYCVAANCLTRATSHFCPHA